MRLFFKEKIFATRHIIIHSWYNMKWFPPIVCLAWLCFASVFSLSAQTKTARAEAYLGNYRYENDRPVGTVKFIFQRAVLSREASGKRNYHQLLIGQKGFTDADNAGDLLAIQISNRGKTETVYADPGGSSSKKSRRSQPVEVEPTYAPEPVVRESARRVKTPKALPAQVSDDGTAATEPAPSADPVRPRPLYDTPEQPVRSRNSVQPGNGGGGGVNISLPDSSQLANSLEDAKQRVTTVKGRMWETAKPVWQFVRWVLDSVIIFLVCLAGLCRYVARTAAAESKVNHKGRVIIGRMIVGAHQNASGMLLIITWVIAVIFLIDIYMRLIENERPLWVLLLVWFPVLWIAERITDWIVPNLRGDH
jgi:ABC-type maltose transport system permease subunit